MAEHNAGIARATYELDARAAEQTLDRVKKNTLEYEAVLKRVLGLGKGGLPGLGGAGGGASPAAGLDKLTAAQARAILTTQKLATEQQKTAREESNAAGAADKAALATLRLSVAQDKAAKGGSGGGGALPRTFAGFTPGGFNQALGAFGLATFGPQIVGQAISQGVEATNAALQLRETKNSLRAVAGDLQTYNQTLQAARAQQRLFGGSLQENIEGLSGLTITARSSGATLQSLIGLSQRLAVLDPAQGAAGARIALNEALSGDPTSLAKRYEIPRAALAKLRDTTLPVEERLRVIDSFLTKVGITAESVAGKVDQDALAFRALGAELGDLQTNAGDRLASAFSGAATGLGRVIGLINGNPQAIAELNAILGGGPTDAGQVAKLRRVTGVTDAAEAARQSRLTAATPDSVFGTFDSAAFNTQNAALDAAKNRLVVLGASSDEMRDKVVALYAEFARTGSIDAFLTGVRNLAGEINHGSKATADARADFAALRDEMQKGAQASQQDAAQKDAQQAITALLAEKNKLAVDQFLVLNPTIDASAAASLAAAQGYGPQIRKLIELGVEARNAKNALAALSGGTVTEGRSERDTPQSLAQARTAGLGLVRDQAAAQAQAQVDRILRTGTAAQIASERQKEYNAAVKQFGANSAQATTAQTTLIEAQQNAKKAATSAGSKGLSADTRADLRLLDDKQARLTEVNRLLSQGHLTELARKQLLIEQADLEKQIGDEIDKQNQAKVDAALDTVRDAQARLKEQREVAGLERQLQSPRFSASQQETARLRLAEIQLEQQKRALDIGREVKASGGAAGAPTGALTGAPGAPLGSGTPLTPGVPLGPIAGLAQASPINLSLTINIDERGQATVSGAPSGVNILDVLVRTAPGGA